MIIRALLERHSETLGDWDVVWSMEGEEQTVRAALARERKKRGCHLKGNKERYHVHIDYTTSDNVPPPESSEWRPMKESYVRTAS